ncbi:putative protein of unknown function (DUF3883) [Trypanosoma vivax]|nr:putative protein of unknown function (DUF3883) [Trypanosoma vivax]
MFLATCRLKTSRGDPISLSTSGSPPASGPGAMTGQQEQPKDNAVPLGVIEDYVKKLLLSQQASSKSTHTKPMTVENILSKVLGRFYGDKGQPPLPDVLPFALKQIPSLAGVAAMQSQLTQMVQGAVATRPVVTVYELQLEVCRAMNVASYAELGLGASLACMPFVQHAFGFKPGPAAVAPVTSADFMRFLLFDADARIVLTSGGDAGDAVRAFAKRYEGGRYAPRQLGIHIQHFSWLLHFVRQEVGKTTAFFAQLVGESVRVRERNGQLYTKILESIHNALACRSQSSLECPLGPLVFRVHASPDEVAGADVPESLWSHSYKGPEGGLCLHGILQGNPPPHPPPHSAANVCDYEDGEGPLLQIARPLASPQHPSTTPAYSALSAVGANGGVRVAGEVFKRGCMPTTVCAGARKRRRGAVVDDRVTVPEDVVPRPAAATQSPTTATVDSAAPCHPSIPLESVLSTLRCLAELQSRRLAHPPVAPEDYASFRSCIVQLLPTLTRGTTAAGGVASGAVLGSAWQDDPFAVTLDVLAAILSSAGAPNILLSFYDALYETLEGRSSAPLKASMLQCFDSGLDDAMFLPVYGTRLMFPLAAGTAVVRERVVISGSRKVGGDLLAFHPLHIVVGSHTACGGAHGAYRAISAGSEALSSSCHAQSCQGEGDCDFLLFVDGASLFGCLSQEHCHAVDSQLLEHLERHGVLPSVPEKWFHSGLLARLLRRQVEKFHDNGTRSEAEVCRFALRMLLLYWWLVALWCEHPQSRLAEAVRGLLCALRGVRWLPCLMRGGEVGCDRGISRLRVVRWCTTSELLHPPSEGVADDLSQLLFVAPHDCGDILLLFEQDAIRSAPTVGGHGTVEPHTVDTRSTEATFLHEWVPAVMRCAARGMGRRWSLATLTGMPQSCSLHLAVEALRHLKAGMRVCHSTLRDLMRCIASSLLGASGDLRAAMKGRIAIPLPHTYDGLADNDSFVVGEMAACDTVFWTTSMEGCCGRGTAETAVGEPGQDTEVDLCLFNRSIQFMGDDLRDFFVSFLGVSPTPSLSAWLAAARNCRRQTPAGPAINKGLTRVFLSALSRCCIAEYARLLGVVCGLGLGDAKQCHSLRGEGVSDSAAQTALDQLVALVPGSTSSEYLFPLSGKWRSPCDGLLFCGSQYCGFDGLALVHVSPDCEPSVDVDVTFAEAGNSPLLPVLIFTYPNQPHFTVVSVLHKMGLMSLEDCTQTTVTFSHMNTENRSVVHRAISECVPRVQHYLKVHYPRYYSLISDQVRKRLENFSTVLAKEPQLREDLLYGGSVYSMVRPIRCRYVKQHNCFYGADEEFTSVVLADGIVDIFTPLTDAEVREGLLRVLRQWLQTESFYVYKGDFPTCGALQEGRWEMRSVAEGTHLSHEECPWELSAAPVLRFRDHFPLGPEGFSFWRQCHGLLGAAGDKPRQKWQDAVVRRCYWVGDSSYMVRSLAKWSCDFFDLPYKVIRSLAQHAAFSCRAEGREDDDAVSAEVVAGATQGLHGTHKRIRRGHRSRRSVALTPVVSHNMNCQTRDTHDYAVAAERFVAARLQEEVPEGVEVVWVNEHGERGTPFDILLVDRGSSKHSPSCYDKKQGSNVYAGHEEIVAYVEVKSTCSNVRRDFEMSLGELLLAARFGKAYKIYRVFRASTSPTGGMHIEVLEDIVSMWHRGDLSLTGEVKVMPTL